MDTPLPPEQIAVFAVQTPPPPITPTETNEFAGFSVRLTAFILDTAILLIICVPLLFLLQALMSQPLTIKGNSQRDILLGLASIIYNIVLLTKQGATIGQKIMHIRVVDTKYQKIQFPRVLIRETLGKIASSSIFELGYLWVIFDKKKQGWHDKIADTYVIYDKPELIKMSHLPIILILFGVLEPIFPLFLFSSIISSMQKSAANNSPIGAYILVGCIVLLGIAQISYGISLFVKQKREGSLDVQKKKFAKILLIAGFIAAVVCIILLNFFLISSIYSELSTIK